MQKKQLTGFSLIELLIAVSIITMTIALTNVIYANFVQNDQRFSARSEMYADLLELTDEVREVVKNSEDEKGKGTLNSTECDWQIVRSDKKKGFNFDLETGKTTSGGVNYFLQAIELSCKNNNFEIKPFEISVLKIDIGNFGDLG
ncbi:type IV pilin protein [Pseudoalteromonas sp. SSM20]|uniref:type IV pilin protein n=1 Tax=Pseudoalteromonas sp. SSM20 TaxID=3139394 RepID=UPI003BAA969A